MPIFYTGKGDSGRSAVGLKKYAKNSPALIALGDLDELNSFLGLVKMNLPKKNLRQKIEIIQGNLFIVQANVSWIIYPQFSRPALAKEKIEELEEEIKKIETKLEPARGFIVPGQTFSAAWLDVARAVARRAERSVVAVAAKYELAPEVLGYLNRLSSYLYALARAETAKSKAEEKRPTYR